MDEKNIIVTNEFIVKYFFTENVDIHNHQIIFQCYNAYDLIKADDYQDHRQLEDQERKETEFRFYYRELLVYISRVELCGCIMYQVASGLWFFLNDR